MIILRAISNAFQKIAAPSIAIYTNTKPIMDLLETHKLLFPPPPHSLNLNRWLPDGSILGMQLTDKPH